MPWCAYPGVNHIHDFDIKYLYDNIMLYTTCNPFICIIIFGLSESYKITLFKDFILEIIEFSYRKEQKKQSSAIFAWIIFASKSLVKVILGDSNRPNICITYNI